MNGSATFFYFRISKHVMNNYYQILLLRLNFMISVEIRSVASPKHNPCTAWPELAWSFLDSALHSGTSCYSQLRLPSEGGIAAAGGFRRYIGMFRGVLKNGAMVRER